MEVVMKYRALDRSEWETKSECLKREEMIVQVKNAMQVLKPTPTECNWKGYVQQDLVSVSRCKWLLYQIANQEGVLKWWIDSQKEKHGHSDIDLAIGTHPSWFGRMLDGGHAPLGDAYHRLCCIDSELREWNQPYYANNPQEGEMVCVG